MLKNTNKKKKGFTLIELIIVIAIIGILAAIAIPSYSGFQDRARRTQVVTDAKQIATAIDTKLVESADGKLVAATGLTDKIEADIANNAVVSLSGVPATRITEITIGESGTFLFKEKINTIVYTAERKTGETAVIVTP